jgi:hypothetical protein
MVLRSIEHKGFIAELHRDDTSSPVSYRYVIVRKDDPTVLCWGVEGTEDIAEREARYNLVNYAERAK